MYFDVIIFLVFLLENKHLAPLFSVHLNHIDHDVKCFFFFFLHFIILYQAIHIFDNMN